MGLNSESCAALVFLVLYTVLFSLLLLGYATRRLRLRSRYTLILFHVTVRLASQATGLAFGVLGYQKVHLLVAYFILGAEGYFTLVLCTYRFLIEWQYRNTRARDSWLEPRHAPGTPVLKKIVDSMRLFGTPVRPMGIIHNLLIGANAVIISGGSMLVGNSTSVATLGAHARTARAMRVSGQGVFLAVNVFLLFCLGATIRESRRERPGAGVHATLWLLLATWPLLFVRGLYGILSSVLTAFNYFSPSNYGADGLTDKFLASEYVMSTTMEWCSCALLMLTYVTSRNDGKEVEGEEVGKEGKAARDSCEDC